MNESITRAAGGVNGQLLDEAAMAQLTAAIGRPLSRRSTLYRPTHGEGETRSPASL